jgi:histone H3/H4
MEITRPSITRLARRAGIKSVSEDCYDNVRALLTSRLDQVIQSALVVNSEHQTKTLMPEDVYEALALMGENLTQSSDLGTSTVSK